MAWKGIPKFMHQRPKGQHDSPTYICGTSFQSWSSKWMGAHSDTTEVDGETVFRFTVGKEVAHLPLCPDCWAADTYMLHLLPLPNLLKPQLVSLSSSNYWKKLKKRPVVKPFTFGIILNS